MRQCFHNMRAWTEELDVRCTLILLWRYNVPGPHSRTHRGAIFSAYHSSFIMAWLQHCCYLTCRQNTSQSPKLLEEFLTCSCWTGTIWGCSILVIYTWVLSVFMCTLDTFTWPLQGRSITPAHSSHLTTSISQAAVGEKATDTELIIT